MHNPIKNKTLEQAAKHELSTCKKPNKTFFCAVCDKEWVQYYFVLFPVLLNFYLFIAMMLRMKKCICNPKIMK